jgi:hypothetical protein
MAFAGALSMMTTSTSGHRLESARRARRAAFSALRSIAASKIDPLCLARGFRAITTRTRDPSGHGNWIAVVIAAWAGLDPSVATNTRKSRFVAIRLVLLGRGGASHAVDLRP